MRKELIFCDICGREKREIGNHWSNGIYPLIINFKNFPNIQQDIQKDECCTDCAKALKNTIVNRIEELKNIYTKQREKER